MSRARVVRRTLVGALLVAALVGIVVVVIGALQPRRTTPVYEPRVLAGQQLWGACAGGFYARRGEEVVLTSSGHCAVEGTVAHDPDGTVRGVFGPAARSETCAVEGRTCAASDMNYLVVALDRIPWGHLNEVDLGEGGYRVIEPGTRALGCADIDVGDPVEINGRDRYRSGTVLEKGTNDFPDDPMVFPCMIAAGIEVGVGDSGGAVLVGGLPGGVASRSFGGRLGFTPLAEGLAELGLVLCTAPDCGLAR